MPHISFVVARIANSMPSKGGIHDVEWQRHERPQRRSALASRVAFAAVLSLCLTAGPGCGVEDSTELSDEDASGAHVESVQSDVTAAPCTLHLFPPRWLCNNRVAPVFRDPNASSPRVDTLRTNPSIFKCRIEGGPSGGGPHPHRWERTQGDDFGAFGYVRDIDIFSETNILPPC
jgi:hypothetical protein